MCNRATPASTKRKIENCLKKLVQHDEQQVLY